MPDLSVIGSILVVHWLLTMSPGANTVLVAQTAVASGRVNAFAVIAGICASGAIWVTSAARRAPGALTVRPHPCFRARQLQALRSRGHYALRR